MNDRKSISYYKEQAKENLLGNYGMVVGSFVLIFALFYCLYSVIANAITGLVGMRNIVAAFAQGTDYFKVILIQEGISLIGGAFFALLLIGYFNILRMIARGEHAMVSDLFYAFRNHPDKVLIMYFILYVIRIIVFIPSDYVNYTYMKFESLMDLDGKMFLIWIVMLLVECVVYVYISLTFSMCYFVYLYEERLSAIECLMKSHHIMKGNKLRYLYMILSFLGYWILGILSVGIGFLYTMAYQTMSKLNMYKDIAEVTEADNDNQSYYEQAFYS